MTIFDRRNHGFQLFKTILDLVHSSMKFPKFRKFRTLGVKGHIFMPDRPIFRKVSSFYDFVGFAHFAHFGRTAILRSRAPCQEAGFSCVFRKIGILADFAIFDDFGHFSIFGQKCRKSMKIGKGTRPVFGRTITSSVGVASPCQKVSI